MIYTASPSVISPALHEVLILCFSSQVSEITSSFELRRMMPLCLGHGHLFRRHPHRSADTADKVFNIR